MNTILLCASWASVLECVSVTRFWRACDAIPIWYIYYYEKKKRIAFEEVLCDAYEDPRGQSRELTLGSTSFPVQ